MTVSIVNGYVCFNCTDTEKAQKGIDPANPTNDPSQNKSVQTRKAEAVAIARADLNQTQADSGIPAGSGSPPDGTVASARVHAPAQLAPGTGVFVDLTA